jgi:energy-coupling factor transport system ATP-binding protein
LATLASGSVFTFILKLILGLPMSVYIYAMLPVVATVAVLNGIVTQVLFAPAQKLFFGQGAHKQ